MLPDTPKDKVPENAPPQVLYCGPSNKSVDVVAGVVLETMTSLVKTLIALN